MGVTDDLPLRPLAGDVRWRAWVGDALLITALPAVLVAVFALPEPVRRSLVFDYTDPSVLTAYTASFVHLETAHLLVNVVGYALVVPLAYVLSVLNGYRRRFYVVFVTFVFLLPLVLSYLNLAVPRSAVGVGFSGVLLAFVGYLPLAVADHLDVRFGIGPREAVGPAAFFLGLALIAVLSVQSVVPANRTVLIGTSGLVLATLLAAVLFALAVRSRQPRSERLVPTLVEVQGHFEILLVAGVVFVGIKFVAFPVDPVTASGTVNLYAHLLGYALGFTATYSTVVVAQSLPGSWNWL